MSTVLQLSDTHLTASSGVKVNGRDPEERLAQVLRAWQATGMVADLIVLSGDNADDGSHEGCRRLAEALVVLDAPVFAIAGNHDDAAAVTAAFGGATTAEVGAWRVVGASTERPGQTHGTLDVPDTLERLARLDRRPTVLALHHPPVSASTHQWFRLDGATELMAGLAKLPHLRAVISGHLHEAFEFSGPGDLTLLGCPSTLYAIHHDGDSYSRTDDSPTGARVLHLADDGTCTSSLLVA